MDYNCIKSIIRRNNLQEIEKLIASGFVINSFNDWLVRYAAAHGSYHFVFNVFKKGFPVGSMGKYRPTVLQLAVNSNKHWDGNHWDFLLTSATSQELADAAGVAIVLKNLEALKRMIASKRLDLNISTSLTGKTVKELAIAKQMEFLLNATAKTFNNVEHVIGLNMVSGAPQGSKHRSLSPSVAKFFEQTANQPTLTSPTISPFSNSPRSSQSQLSPILSSLKHSQH